MDHAGVSLILVTNVTNWCLSEVKLLWGTACGAYPWDSLVVYLVAILGTYRKSVRGGPFGGPNLVG